MRQVMRARRTEADVAVPAPGSFGVAVAVAMSVGAAGLVLLLFTVVIPRLLHAQGWFVGNDVWTPLAGARYVAHGAVFHLYEPSAGWIGYPYTPALPVLLSPLAAIADRLNLTDSAQFGMPHPTTFLLLGPASGFFGTLPLLLQARTVLRAPTRRRLVTVQLGVLLAAAWAPVVYYHPEDTIACALLVAAVGACARGRWRAVGASLGAAVLFKQWALFPALPVLAAAPRSQRKLVAFYAVGLPALVMVPFFAASSSTWTSLTGARASLALGRHQLWTAALFGGARFADANALRVLWGVLALGVAWRVRGRRDVSGLLAAVGTVVVLRLLVEPTIFAYYLAPGAIFAVAWSASVGRPVLLRAVLSAVLGAWCVPRALPEPVFWGVLALGLCYVCGPMVRTVLVGAQPDETAGRASAASAARLARAVA